MPRLLCDTYTNVHSIHPPNGRELNDKVVSVFRKVFDNLGQAMDHADDDIRPGSTGGSTASDRGLYRNPKRKRGRSLLTLRVLMIIRQQVSQETSACNPKVCSGGDVDIQERVRELPPLGEEQVLVKIRACGVCGTNINFVRDWTGDPMPLGHEIWAEVLEVGRKVTTVRPGDSVIVEDCTMCGVCDACKSGQPQFCRTMYNMTANPAWASTWCSATTASSNTTD